MGHPALGGDVLVRQPLAGELGDLPFHGGEVQQGGHVTLAGGLAGGAQLLGGAGGQGAGAQIFERLESGPQVGTGVDASLCPAQPLPVREVGPGVFVRVGFAIAGVGVVGQRAFEQFRGVGGCAEQGTAVVDDGFRPWPGGSACEYGQVVDPGGCLLAVTVGLAYALYAIPSGNGSTGYRLGPSYPFRFAAQRSSINSMASPVTTEIKAKALSTSGCFRACSWAIRMCSAESHRQMAIQVSSSILPRRASRGPDTAARRADTMAVCLVLSSSLSAGLILKWVVAMMGLLLMSGVMAVSVPEVTHRSLTPRRSVLVDGV